MKYLTSFNLTSFKLATMMVLLLGLLNRPVNGETGFETNTNTLSVANHTGSTQIADALFQFPPGYVGTVCFSISYSNQAPVENCISSNYDQQIVLLPGEDVTIVMDCITNYAQIAPAQVVYTNGITNVVITLGWVPEPLPCSLLVNRSGNQVELTARNVEPGFTYQIQYTDNLFSTWSELTQETIPQGEESFTYYDNLSITNGARFYRGVLLTCY